MIQSHTADPKARRKDSQAAGSRGELIHFPGLVRAGLSLGMSGDALRKKFERGDLPARFLLRLGPRTLRVDIDSLVQFLRAQAGQKSA